MTTVQRLKAAGAILLLAAILTTSHVWGEVGKSAKGDYLAGRSDPAPAKTERQLAEELVITKFTKQPLVWYRSTTGADLFAVQLQPKLAAGPVLPQDIVIVVDTSASQVRGPLEASRLITEKVIGAAADDDRVAVWTVNIPNATRDLTRGLQSPKSDKVRGAVDTLKQEVPFGDTDLKNGLTKAIDSFDGREGRQRIILFLGDGMSLHSPIGNADRQQLCDKMIAKEISFFTVPAGPRLDAVNLHGLATGTGGLLVRQMAVDQPADVVTKLQEAFKAPVLHVKKFQLPAEVSEFYPAKLPPLRSDVPTLVVGQFKPGQKLSYTLEGTVRGKDVRVQVSEEVPAAELDNFFLVSLIEQWKKADNKVVASPFRADRALAMSFERSRLARDEFLVQAQWALQQDNLEAASRLFGEAKRIDPSDVEADAGIKIVTRLRDRVLTRKELLETLSKPEDPAIRIQRKEGDNRVKVSRDQLQNLLAQADLKEMAPPPVAQVDPNLLADNPDFLRNQKQRLAVEEQRINALVNDVERQANRVLQTDPDTAHDLLKRTLGSIRDNADLSPQTRQNLISRLETALRNVEVRGSRIKQDLEARMLAQAAAETKLTRELDRLRGEEQIVRRMKAFGELMNQGRFNEAYREALVMQQDTINRGLTVSPSEVAAYGMGLTGTHLKEVQEIKRASEERYLLTMLQVDKSHIPFPDEPPVEFPPAATWRELTDRRRKAGYDAVGIGETQTGRLAAQALRDKLSRKVNLDKGIDPNTPLKDALEVLSDRYDLTIIINTKAFELLGVQKPEEQGVTLPRMVGVSLSTVLRLLLNQVKVDVYTGTYIVRPDYIEVTTTYNAAAEKVVRAYPVADLVIPIPNAVNQQALQQSLAVYGQFINASPPTFPQFPGATGQPQPQPFNPGFNPNQFSGNPVGQNQFGNLGGQFGLQGQDTSRQLMELIVSVVAPGEWRPFFDPNAQPGAGGPPGAAPPGLAPGLIDPGAAIVPAELLNSIGYYGPARALIVNGSSFQRGGEQIKQIGRVGPPAAMGFNNNRPDNGGAIVIGGKNKTDPVAKTDPKVDPKTDPKATATAMKDVDVRKAWQEAIVKQKAQNKGGIVDPGIIIACADFLVEHRKFDHAAELLKASLREGVVPAEPWVFESLALALQLSDGSAEDIERAQVSAIDVQPQDAKGYIQAAKAMAELKRYDRAVAMCRQAALMEPGMPTAYANALVFAQDGKDGEGMAWAASHLLKQEWTSDTKNLHASAQEKLTDLIKDLEKDGKAADVQRLKAALNQTRRRDLIINLSWQGDAALDLQVKDPIGSVCNYNHKMTLGGGTMVGGGLNEGKTQSYIAGEAYSGQYEVTVNLIWGRSVSAKATLEIIRHQGTPQERVEYQTITFDRTQTVKVSLADGRRTSMADVPPPAIQAEKKSTMTSSDQVLTKLRALSDPVFAPSLEASGFRGGMGSGGTEVLRTRVEAGKPAANPNERMAVHSRVSNYVNQALDMTAQTTVNTDQKEIRVRLNPVFNSVNRIGSSSGTSNPLIPGGF